jgi:hypothetical protein
MNLKFIFLEFMLNNCKNSENEDNLHKIIPQRVITEFLKKIFHFLLTLKS